MGGKKAKLFDDFPSDFSRKTAITISTAKRIAVAAE